jgi:hypothetical protein
MSFLTEISFDSRDYITVTLHNRLCRMTPTTKQKKVSVNNNFHGVIVKLIINGLQVMHHSMNLIIRRKKKELACNDY